jgi:TetR/AcrR family transcriptional repressor of nem operon
LGRKKNYDEVEALEKAMLLIWRKGYEAVSTRELATAMGINQFSLYASFDSKEALFGRALDLYFQRIIKDWLLEPMVVPGAGKDALRRFFEVFVNPGDGTYPAGCMIFNTMAIDEAQRPVIKLTIEKYEALLTKCFADIIRQDFPNASSVEIESKASLLLCFMAGIAIKKRNGFEGRPVQIVVDQIMKSIYVEK